MRLFITQLIITLTWTSYLLGVSLTSFDSVITTFPNKPMELTFDIPFHNHPPQGSFHVFSWAAPSGTFFLSKLELPTLSEAALEPEEFKANFESYFINHLFYYPQVFHDQQTFTHRSHPLPHLPSTTFEFTYSDHGKKKIIRGIAVLKDKTLYHLFYIAPAKATHPDLLTQYQKSLTEFQHSFE